MTPTRAAIVGTGYSSPIVRHSDKPLGRLAMEAAEAAARDAGISVSEIDGLSVYPNPSRLGPSFNDGVDFVSAAYMAQDPTAATCAGVHSSTPGRSWVR